MFCVRRILSGFVRTGYSRTETALCWTLRKTMRKTNSQGTRIMRRCGQTLASGGSLGQYLGRRFGMVWRPHWTWRSGCGTTIHISASTLWWNKLSLNSGICSIPPCILLSATSKFKHASKAHPIVVHMWNFCTFHPLSQVWPYSAAWADFCGVMSCYERVLALPKIFPSTVPNLENIHLIRVIIYVSEVCDCQICSTFCSLGCFSGCSFALLNL